jgi:hypothetical protein
MTNKNLNEQEKAALILASAIESKGIKPLAERPLVKTLAALLAEAAAVTPENTVTVEPKVITGRVSAAVFQKLRQVEE